MSGVVENGGRCTPPTVATKKAPHPVSVHFVSQLAACPQSRKVADRSWAHVAVRSPSPAIADSRRRPNLLASVLIARGRLRQQHLAYVSQITRLTPVFDAADGTNNRLHQSALRMVNISRIFVTHMHADHVLGVVAIMAVIMSGVGQTEAGLARLRAAGTAKKVR